MSFTEIKYDVADKIATITLNRPEKLNAFTGVMMAELIEAFGKADADDNVRVVIVTGAGRGFCAGGDIRAIHRSVLAGDGRVLTIKGKGGRERLVPLNQAARAALDRYLGVLRSAHADANLDHVMCRNLISVDWQGFVYDCDFNQMLDLPLAHGGRPRVHLSDLLDADLAGNPIRVAGHCYGCTAGQGSSCGGALV